jgi:hypothetical protein
MMNDSEMEKHLLKIISAEIEQRFDCKVIDISLCSIIGTPNVQVKIQYNGDFIYKPCENWTPDSIVFSERSVRFFRRIDFFECVKKLGVAN